MKLRTYRICLICMVVIALAAGFYFYNRISDRGEEMRGALLVMEESDGKSDGLY